MQHVELMLIILRGFSRAQTAWRCLSSATLGIQQLRKLSTKQTPHSRKNLANLTKTTQSVTFTCTQASGIVYSMSVNHPLVAQQPPDQSCSYPKSLFMQCHRIDRSLHKSFTELVLANSLPNGHDSDGQLARATSNLITIKVCLFLGLAKKFVQAFFTLHIKTKSSL